jgi:hypothetical protein
MRATGMRNSREGWMGTFVQDILEEELETARHPRRRLAQSVRHETGPAGVCPVDLTFGSHEAGSWGLY